MTKHNTKKLILNSLHRRASIAIAIGTLSLVAKPIGALAQVDYFAQVSGVSGESVDSHHPGWIDVSSIIGGVTAAQTPTLSFSAKASAASPYLLLGAASGQHFSTATVSVRRGLTSNPDYLKYVMTDVVLVSDGFAGSGGSAAVEQYQMSYSTLQIEYRAQRPDGSWGPPIITCWDFVNGVSCS